MTALMTNMLVLGMGGSPSGAGQQQQAPGMMIGWLVIMAALFYFMMILPQQRREKERRKLIDSIKSGDRVLFAGGLIGVVANVKPDVFIIKVADNTKVEVVRAAVTRVLQDDNDLRKDIKE
ncbi:MAG: preprotein translocase subunit YajC [Kiritimatiellia bacterium]|jgi:preprotein translocase subunit YajC